MAWRQVLGGACQAALPTEETREVGKPKSPGHAGGKGGTASLICLCPPALVRMWRGRLVPQQPLGSMRRREDKSPSLGI